MNLHPVRRILLFGAASALSLSAWAGPRQPSWKGALISIDPATIVDVKADQVGSGSVSDNRIQWATKTSVLERNATNWQMAFDSMSINPGTQSAFSSIYGVTPQAPLKAAGTDDYRMYMFANDMTALAPGTAGKFARYIKLAAFWNPAGTTVKSGSAKPAVKVWCATRFDRTTNGPAADYPLSQVIYAAFPTYTAGSQYFSIDLSGTSLGLPLPVDGIGALVVQFGLSNGATFTPLAFPYAVQPLLSNMYSATDAAPFKGTNPSRSTDSVWADDSDPNFVGFPRSDYIFQDFTNSQNSSGGAYAEYYSFDMTSSSPNQGILQPSTSLLVDPSVRTISGKVVLNDLAVAGTGPRVATFEIDNASGTTVLNVETVALGADGSFTLLDPNPTSGGSYLIYAKASHWLKNTFFVTTTSGNSTGSVVALTNGDVDGNNAINILDYAYFSDHFLQDSSWPGWDYPDDSGMRIRYADLDENGAINIIDYAILSDNFNKVGS